MSPVASGRTGASPARPEVRGRRPARRGRRLILQSGFLVIVLALWWLVNATALITPELLPGPVSTFVTWAQLLPTAEYWSAVASTLSGAAVGLAAATVIGVPIGLLTGTFPRAERSSRLLLDVLRTYPVIAILPVFLLVFGATSTMKSVIVFIGCVFIMILQAHYGASSVTSTIRETVRSYRIPRRLWYSHVVLPSAVPSIMTGLRLAAAMSVLIAIAVEVLTTVPGIGAQVAQSQLGNNAPAAWAYILTAGALGFAIVRLSEAAESHFLRWRPPAHAGADS